MPERQYPGVLTRLGSRMFGGNAGNVFRGMTTLALGSTGARIIGVAAIPVLTRIYSPEDFGVLAVFIALVAMLVPVLTLRYVVAVPLPRHDGMAMNLMVLSAGLMGVTALAIGPLLWAFGPSVLAVMSMEVLAPWWWLVVLGLVGTGAYELLTMWATRRRAYRPIARTQLFQSALGVAVKIGLGLLALKPLGLLVGQVAAQSGGVGSLGFRFVDEFRANMRFVDRRRLWFAARRYSSFPVYRLPSQFLLVFSMQAPILLSAAFFSGDEVGNLGLALSLIALPLSIIGVSTSQAFYAEIASIGRKRAGDIIDLCRSVMTKLFFVSIVPAFLIFLLSPYAFPIVFGEEWRLAGELASYLAIYLLSQFVASPIANVLNMYDALHYVLIMNVLRCASVIIIFNISYSMDFDINETVLLYSISMFLYYVAYAFLVLMIVSRKKDKST